MHHHQTFHFSFIQYYLKVISDEGNLGLIPGLGIFPGGGHGNPLQYSCLENPMDREDWWATVPGVAKSQIQLNQLNTQTQFIFYHLFLQNSSSIK